MTTYTVNITNNIDFDFNHYEQTTKQVKEIKAQYKSSKTMKVTTTKNVKCYYRGSEVIYIEARQNGWTLVHVPSKGTDVFAVTAELEYK